MRAVDTPVGTKVNIHKKVLLRERKRHTARRVAALPGWWRGGYPVQVWMVGGTPSQVCGVPWPGLDGGGYPVPGVGGYPDLARGYPGYPLYHPDLARVPPPPTPDLGGGTPYHPDLDGVPHLRPEMGSPPPTIQTWTGYFPTSDLRWGPPPHHPDLDGVPPPTLDLRWGTPPSTIQTWTGYPPPPQV